MSTFLPQSFDKPLRPGLYVTATPIGNLGDMTLRAIATLKNADIILCEDTRVTGKLTKAFDITTPLKSYHDHNGARMRPLIMTWLAEGEKIALVSDAGTPLISDPGYKLVRAVHAAGHTVYAVPGASALTASISIAGLPTDAFLFAGFLPAKQGAKSAFLQSHAHRSETVVFYETGARLADSLRRIAAIDPSRTVAIARELTKLHEDLTLGTAAELADAYAEKDPKGEIVLIMEGASPEAPDIDALLTKALESHSVRDAAADVAGMTGLSRKDCYARALALQKEKKDDEEKPPAG